MVRFTGITSHEFQARLDVPYSDVLFFIVLDLYPFSPSAVSTSLIDLELFTSTV